MTLIQLKNGSGSLVEQRRQRLLAVLLRAVEAGDDRAGALAPGLLRERVHRRHRLQADEGAELLRRGRQEVAVGRHDLLAVFGVPEDRPGIDHAHRVGLEQEARDHAEIAAAAAQRPEQVRVLLRARGDETAVGEHHVGLEQIVDGQPVLARQVAGPAAERQASDAGGRDDAEWDRQAEGMRRVVDIARRAARPDPNGAGRRVDPYPFHHRQVDDQPVVDAAEARAVVAAAADGDEKAVVAAEIDRCDHVGNIDALRDQQRPLVDHAVIERARLVIVRVARA